MSKNILVKLIPASKSIILQTIIFLAFIVIILFPLYVHSSTDTKKHVLVLHSYHQGLVWTDDIMKGIHSVFDKYYPQYEVNVEYMDTKRYFDGLRGKYLTRLYDMYKDKYSATKPDIIISSDDNAFQFLLMHHDELFPGKPIVFCGVNNFEDTMLAGHDLVTGVIEFLDKKANIDIALKLHPDAREIAIITDTTETGAANRTALVQLADEFKDRTSFMFLDKDNTGLTLQELLIKLRQLPEKSIVFYSDFLRTRGEYIMQEIAVPQISEASKRPIYTHYDEILGLGVVGGKLVNGFSHGSKAAQMASDILRGTPVSSLPVYKESINTFMFDYKLLTRFGIDENKLPQGSEVINRPSSFYSEHKQLIWTVLGVFSVLTISLISISLNVSKRKKAEEKLKIAHDRLEERVIERTDELKRANEQLGLREELFRGAFEYSSIGIALVSPEGIFFRVNPVLCNIVGYTQEELLSLTFQDITHPDDLEADLAYVRQMLAGEIQFYHMGKRYFHKDKSIVWIQLSVSLVRDKFSKPVHFVAQIQDITKRKKTDEVLRLYERMVSVTGDHMFFVSKDYIYQAVNPVYLNAHKKNHEDIIGRSISDILGKELFEKNIIDRCLKGEEINYQEWFEFSGLGRRFMDVSYYPYYEIDGDISGVVVSSHDITEHKKAEDQIMASLKEKEVLLQEIHHRVKNNMTVIYSLLKLQADKTSNANYKELLNESINRIKSMALIHEKLYNSDSLSEINFKDYLTELIKSIFASYKTSQQRIALSIDVKGIFLGVDIAIPCGLIINELVANSLKHAFPEHRAGEIKVKMWIEDQGEVKLMITDNGIGMPDNLDLKKSASLGLTMVDSLIRQLRGRLEMQAEEGVGFIITFMRRI